MWWRTAVLVLVATGCGRGQVGPAPSPSASASTIAAATAPSASAAPKKSEYKAPLGLTWAQSPNDAKSALAKRLTFRREYPTDGGKLIEQSYGGSFAGTVADMIALDFSPKGGLVAVSVLYPAVDERPVSKRWEELTEKMRAEYGEPVQLVPPPKTQAEAIAEGYPDTPNRAKVVSLLGASSPNRYEELDAKIVKGEWGPSAVWGFSNVAVLIGVNDTKDSAGKHVIKPSWMFLTKEGLTELQGVAQTAPKDF